MWVPNNITVRCNDDRFVDLFFSSIDETALEADRQNFGEHGVQTRSTGVELASLADLQAETVEMRRARLAASFETLSTSQADD
eukprot:SAG31_NODE_4689_length_3024_cov_6.956329_1_plen_83_part_00